MNKDYYKKLTLAVYKVTELFPEKEPLRWQIRELANKILANLILANPHINKISNRGDLLKDIKILDGYFEIVQAQNWLDSRNFLVLKREYDKIKELIGETGMVQNTEKTVENSLSAETHGVKADLPKERQEKILNILKEKKTAKIGELIQSFSGLSRRTMIRDLDRLCRMGIIIRNGNGRGICYTVKM